MKIFKNKAFTLSEVLITLGVIGIIASMTLPTVVNKYQKRQTEVQLKQAYTILLTLLKRAEADYGPLKDSNVFDGEIFIDQYVKPYSKVIKEFTPAESADMHVYCRKSQAICDEYGKFCLAHKVILSNGMLFAPFGLGSSGLTVIVDLNGLKRPNRYGRDVFMFNTDTEKVLVPYGAGIIAGNSKPDFTREQLLTGESRACKNDGLYCAALIMVDGWKILADYPW